MPYLPLPRSAVPLIATATMVLTAWLGWETVRDPESLWAPGDLSHYHREVATCRHCHEPFQGPTAGRCLTCHSPQQFATAGTTTVGAAHLDVVRNGERCLSCHTEHRGMFAPITIGALNNPHSEFVFRATGARSCAACHAFSADTRGPPTLLDTTAVRRLLKKGEGAHRPGAFAHCLRCHISGKVNLDHDD